MNGKKLELLTVLKAALKALDALMAETAEPEPSSDGWYIDADGDGWLKASDAWRLLTVAGTGTMSDATEWRDLARYLPLRPATDIEADLLAEVAYWRDKQVKLGTAEAKICRALTVSDAMANRIVRMKDVTWGVNHCVWAGIGQDSLEGERIALCGLRKDDWKPLTEEEKRTMSKCTSCERVAAELADAADGPGFELVPYGYDVVPRGGAAPVGRIGFLDRCGSGEDGCYAVPLRGKYREFQTVKEAFKYVVTCAAPGALDDAE